MKSSRSSTNNSITPLFPQASCWIIVDMDCSHLENQCFGLAEALGLIPTLKHVEAVFPYTYLPKRFWRDGLQSVSCNNGSLLEAKPKVTIASGPTATAVAHALKSRLNCFAISVGEPSLNAPEFDVIVPLPHEKLQGDNVVPVLGHLHRISPSSLIEAKLRYVREATAQPHPRIMLHLDDQSPHLSLSTTFIEKTAQNLKKLHETEKIGLYIHLLEKEKSKDLQLLLETQLLDLPYSLIGEEDAYAYQGYLAHMDAFVTTADATQFMSEAMTCGKPIFILPSLASSALNETLTEKGVCFQLDEFSMITTLHRQDCRLKPLFEPQRIAKLIWEIYKTNVGTPTL